MQNDKRQETSHNVKNEKCLKNHRKTLFFSKSTNYGGIKRDLGGVQYHVVMRLVSGLWSFCNVFLQRLFRGKKEGAAGQYLLIIIVIVE